MLRRQKGETSPPYVNDQREIGDPHQVAELRTEEERIDLNNKGARKNPSPPVGRTPEFGESWCGSKKPVLSRQGGRTDLLP